MTEDTASALGVRSRLRFGEVPQRARRHPCPFLLDRCIAALSAGVRPSRTGLCVAARTTHPRPRAALLAGVALDPGRRAAHRAPRLVTQPYAPHAAVSLSGHRTRTLESGSVTAARPELRSTTAPTTAEPFRASICGHHSSCGASAVRHPDNRLVGLEEPRDTVSDWASYSVGA